EQIRVDGADAHTPTPSRLHGFLRVRQIRSKIPQHVHGHARTAAGQAMYLARIGKLLLESGCGGWVQKLPESGAGLGKTPRGQLDLADVVAGAGTCAVRLDVSWRHVKPGRVRKVS